MNHETGSRKKEDIPLSSATKQIGDSDWGTLHVRQQVLDIVEIVCKAD